MEYRPTIERSQRFMAAAKVKYLLCLLTASLLASMSCIPGYAIGSKIVKNGSTIEVAENSASAKVEYRSPRVLEASLREKAQNELWSADKLEYEIRSIPKGGYILIRISGPTIASANPKWWEYVIHDLQGTEILRQSGENDIPEHTTSQYGTTWWNIDGIPLLKPMPNKFKIYVIDRLSKSRSAFIIYPDQEVQ
jgi:hypothetical protein